MKSQRKYRVKRERSKPNRSDAQNSTYPSSSNFGIADNGYRRSRSAINKRKREKMPISLPKRSNRLKHLYYDTHPYVLAIIDIQPCFSAANSEALLDNISDLIVRAIHESAYVLHVRYYGHESNTKCLTDLTTDYEDTGYCGANQADKSNAILNHLRKNNINATRIKICGVNTAACVNDTVEGLSEKTNDKVIEVVGSCLGCSYTIENAQDIEFGKLYNVAFTTGAN